MPSIAKIPLSKTELADKVRDRIRQYRGCERVDAIVLHEIIRPEARWEIAAIVAGSAEYDAVRAVAKEVQQQLQALYIEFRQRQ